MLHEWQNLVLEDPRPHRRCVVCRTLRVYPPFAMPSEMDAMDAVGDRQSCPGPFVMPPVFSEEYRARVRAWARAGRPVRGRQTVGWIWRTCCEPCEQRGKESVCGACGCRVLTSGPPECNLIAMATETCPIGKWI